MDITGIPFFLSGGLQKEAFEEPVGLRKTQLEIKYALGGEAGLLEEYLLLVYRGILFIQPYIVAEDGLVSARILREICRAAMEHTGRHRDPFYDEALRYMQLNPLELYNGATRFHLYCALLSMRYLAAILPDKQDEYAALLARRVPQDKARSLYEEICGLLGSQQEMENLNGQIREHYLHATVMQLFTQAYVTESLLNLTYIDPASGKSCNTLLLEFMEKNRERAGRIRQGGQHPFY